MEIDQQKLFLELYSPLHKKLTKYCRALAGNVADAEDLMNDTIVAVINSFGKLKNRNAFKSYIFSIATNINKLKFRRLKFKAEFNEYELSQIADLSYNPEKMTDMQLIFEEIDRLPDKMKEAFILFHISGLTIDEICAIQGVTPSGVKSRLKRGREKLLKLLNTTARFELEIMLLTF